MRTSELLGGLGFVARAVPVPAEQVAAAGLRSITNLLVRHDFGAGPVIALNAHGDVVPPGAGWTHPPYAGEIADGRLYGRGAAVSKSDFATFSFALRALIDSGIALQGAVELHFTYDEEFGGELGPGYLLSESLTRPDVVIAAGFSYQVINAHNGCLQFEVKVEGRMAHAAIPSTGIDALQGAVSLMSALYRENQRLATIHSAIEGIDTPYLNIGLISGGTNTNVVPGEVIFKFDRRMVPEEDPATVEAELRALIKEAASHFPAATITIRRILFARPLRPTERSNAVARVLQQHASSVFHEAVPICGTPLYADARLYAEHGVAAVLYGAGPRTLLESNAKRADEHVVLEDLRGATKVIARSLVELLQKV
jgi:acetylornithine deacetylase/succinyl-diaminopimelate desuccinylase-like protein